jgi:hypothetical protein
MTPFPTCRKEGPAALRLRLAPPDPEEQKGRIRCLPEDSCQNEPQLAQIISHGKTFSSGLFLGSLQDPLQFSQRGRTDLPLDIITTVTSSADLRSINAYTGR